MWIFALVLMGQDAPAAVPAPTPALCKSAIMTTYLQIAVGSIDPATGKPKRKSKERAQVEQDLGDAMRKLDARFGALETGDDGMPGRGSPLFNLTDAQLLAFDHACLDLPQ